MSKWKQLLGKKWAFPAIYMIAAALILALMWWYQDPNEYPITREDLGLEEVNPSDTGQLTDEALADKFGDALAVNQPTEQMQWPVLETNTVSVTKEFFDEEASDEELEAAIVSFQNELWPHRGVDIVSTNGQEFMAVAALSGQVIRAEKDPVVGNIVEIQHQNGLVTVYSSLKDLQVKQGDNIAQGAVIGTASKNIFEKDEGVHLHFEVRLGETVYNPNLFFGQDIEQVLKNLTNNEGAVTEDSESDIDMNIDDQEAEGSEEEAELNSETDSETDAN